LVTLRDVLSSILRILSDPAQVKLVKNKSKTPAKATPLKRFKPFPVSRINCYLRTAYWILHTGY